MYGLWFLIGFILAIPFTLVVWWYNPPGVKEDKYDLLHIFSGPPTKLSEYAECYHMYWVYRVNDSDFEIHWGWDYLGGNIPINLKGIDDPIGLAKALMCIHFPEVMQYRLENSD